MPSLGLFRSNPTTDPNVNHDPTKKSQKIFGISVFGKKEITIWPWTS